MYSKVTLNFELEYIGILVIDILIQILLTRLTFNALFCEKYQFVIDGFSLV